MHVGKVVEEYMSGIEWAVRDNANVPWSLPGLLSHVLGEALKEYALEALPRRSVELHEEGWIYIYKLRDGSAVKPYCGGLDSKRVIESGLRTVSVVSKPPKHLDSAVDQLVNAVYMFSQERTGAVGLYGVDMVLAPYVARDRLSYRDVKQNVQRFVYNLNYPLKAGQSPFTNVVFAFSNKFYRAQSSPGIGFRLDEPLESFVDEAVQVVKAFVEVFREGDAVGQPFTFPIPTSIVNSDFVKMLSRDLEVWEAYWSMVSEVGQMYFLNGFRTMAEDLFSFCCRLLSDMSRVREILHQAKGVWDMPPSVGSVNVVVVNAPRLAVLARVRDDKAMFEKLDELLEVSREALNWFRSAYTKLFRAGLYPMTREYIDRVDPFKFYYNTVGVIGLAEYASIMLGEPRLWLESSPSMLPEIEKLYRALLEHINSRLKEFEEADGVLYNVEEVPGETLGIKLAWKDWDYLGEFSKRFSDDLRAYIPVGEVDGRKTPFYTNQLTPPYTSLHLRYQLDLEASCQKLFTGGVIKHVFVDGRLEPETVSKFVLRTLESKDVVYLSITPTIAVCPNCGRRWIGRRDKCPSCGSQPDLWSRIVGYYRPVKSWNDGRRAEFALRRDMSREVEELA